jgi:drug/metabolite transporter (DMT)-like permease
MHPYRLYIPPLLAACIWAGNYIVTKLSAGLIAPMAMAFCRWLIAVLVLFPFVVTPLWRKRQIIYPHLVKFAVLGLLGMAVYQGLAYISAQTTSAINISIITATIPLFTLLLNRIILRERATYPALLGCVVSLVGLILVMSQGQFLCVGLYKVQLGDGLIFIASLAYAAYNILLHYWSLPVTSWPSLWLQAFFGMLFLLPGFLLSPTLHLTLQHLPLILYAGLLASLIAPICWMISIKTLGANRASIFINLAPLITMMMAVGFLNEALTRYHIGGGVLTLLGVLLTQIRR